MRLAAEISLLARKLPQGFHADLIVQKFGAGEMSVRKVLWRMVTHSETLKSARDPVQGASSRLRYFAPEHEATALAQISPKAEVKPRREGKCGMTQAMEVLLANPQGMYSAELAKALGVRSAAASKTVNKLRESGFVGSFSEPCSHAPVRSRWYAKVHVEAARAEHLKHAAAGFAVGLSKRKEPDTPPQYWGARVPQQELSVDPPRFADLGAGRYLPVETWTTRVYA